jgi:hypothetical protein
LPATAANYWIGRSPPPNQNYAWHDRNHDVRPFDAVHKTLARLKLLNNPGIGKVLGRFWAYQALSKYVR